MSKVRILAVVVALAAAVSACSSESSDAGRSDGVRSIETVRGTIEVPQEPMRVVTLEPVELDTAVALGVTPVGTAVLSEATGAPAYLGAEAASVDLVGTVPEPRVEAIAALEPDLILGTESRHAAFYDQLAAIAPTVFLENHAAPWKDNVRFVAAALGLEDRAEDLLTDYQDRCAEIAEKHSTAGKTAQLIRPRNGELTLYGPTSFAGSTLECAGFTTPPRAEWANEISVDLSPELASQAAADFVLVTATDPSDPAAIPPSVTANAAVLPNPHAVDQSYWITGVGPEGGLAVLDDIDRILSEQS